MSCIYFSKSEGRAMDSRRRRFSWGFFSQYSASCKKSEKLALSLPSSEPQEISGQDVQTCRNEAPVFGEPCDVVDNDANTPTTSSSSRRPPHELRVFSYVELRVATRNFSRSHLLGEGGFGCVYKASIKFANLKGSSSSRQVAVKQLNRKSQQGHKEWLSEVHFLGMVEHPNLVKLVGFCAEDNDKGIHRLLVYEFMPNKSLEDHLFEKGPSVLSWEERLRIMLGAARGLAYLHEEISDIQVIFRDFKASNVLLDKDFTPKLSDFGLARQGPETGASHVSTEVVGTWGYAAPEYLQTGHLTSKSDVWSFGVVLLEMLSGRRSMDRNRPKSEQQLMQWMRPFFQGNKKVHSFIDPKLEGRYSLVQAERIAALARQCLHKAARTRPLMSAVVEELKEIVDLPESVNAEVSAVSSSPSLKSSRTMEDTKESAQTKRRLLLLQSVRKFTHRVDVWRAWIPKAVYA